MKAIIPPKRTTGPIGGKSAVQAKLWPNGEVSIWRPKTFKLERRTVRRTVRRTEVRMAWFRLQCESRILREALASLLGLSIHPIFDKSIKGEIISSPKDPKTRSAKGLKGLTSYGGRMVRNVAHCMEQDAGRARCIFATVTVPTLPLEQMAAIHHQWDKITEYYRLGIRRALQSQGLSGEIVSVSEVQTERYKRTGLPVLHLHAVFVGVTAVGKFAITVKKHDDIWYRALSSVVSIPRSKISTACNLQRVKKSASAYLGKYLSKSVKDVNSIVDKGFGGWLPKHWWNCSRKAVQRVKRQTRRIDDFADWLNVVAVSGGDDVWRWHREVVLEMSDGYKITIARYGQLTNSQTAEIQAYYDYAKPRSSPP